MTAPSNLPMFSGLLLDRSGDVPLFQQLYRQVRQAILSGRIPAGERLPATRILAQELSVSRNTVISAFEQLFAEGYLEGQIGSGTYVSRVLPEELLVLKTAESVEPPPAELAVPNTVPEPASPVTTYEHKAYLVHSPVAIWANRGGTPRAFSRGTPALDQFPYKLWGKLVTRYWKEPRPALLNYGRITGYEPLRKAIAEYLRAARGVQCTTDQIIVVSGSQQGLDLTCRVLLNPGEQVWIEDPGYHGAQATFLAYGAKLTPVPLDAEGMDLKAAQKMAPRAKLAFVTPSHQFPLGVTMSLQRRLRLLEWAETNDAWIIEDDYDSEFRYSGRPLASLQGLDKSGRVIYLGTFSKVLFPSLRLGYLVVPESLVQDFTTARAISDQHSPLVEQAVVTDFITEGHFARHIRNMRALYAERQRFFLAMAQERLSGLLEVAPDDAGMHCIGWLPPHVSDKIVAQQAAAVGLDVTPLSLLAMGDFQRSGLILAYVCIDEPQIEAGIDRLAEVLRPLVRTGGSAG